MIDSMLTLTKRGAFWMAILFAVAVVLDIGVSALVGQQEALFLLLALAIAALFLVAAAYTLGKKVIGLFKGKADKTPLP
jgi:putative Mn2+ efflux pump MntP